MPKNIKDALRLASTNSDFAGKLVTEPESYQAEYSLTRDQIDHLKKLGAAATSANTSLTGASSGPMAYE